MMTKKEKKAKKRAKKRAKKIIKLLLEKKEIEFIMSGAHEHKIYALPGTAELFERSIK